MKYLFLWFFVGISSAMAQKLDTIGVNASGTAYLLFDEPISLFNIGSKAYIGKIENERMIFLRSLANQGEPTTLLAQAGETLFTGYIRYERTPKRNFYDYRASAKTASESRSSTQAAPSSKSVGVKLLSMKKAKDNCSYDEKKDGIQVRCTQLFNDRQRTYVKLSIKNTTTAAFVIDWISFTHKERIPRRIRNKVAPQYEESTPEEKIEPARIEAGREEHFYYCLPLYSTTFEGFLEIICREKTGARVVVVEIPSKKIQESPLL